MDPVDAIRALAEMTFDHHIAHPDFIRLVAIENIHRGEFIARLDTLRTLSAPAVSPCWTQILARGRAAGQFPRRRRRARRAHGDQRVLRVPGRQPHTFGYLFGRDLAAPENHDHLRG